MIHVAPAPALGALDELSAAPERSIDELPEVAATLTDEFVKEVPRHRLRIVPLELRELNELVARWHRHHKPVQGHRFSIGVTGDGELLGGASVGRPVARALSAKEVLEVTRLVTNGSFNACSKLYAAAAKIGKELGYRLIQTYILDNELGTSLKAAGWRFDGMTTHTKPWTHTDGKARRDDQPYGPKQRWVKELQSA